MSRNSKKHMLGSTPGLDELKLLSHKDIVRFALFCVEQVRDEWGHIPEYAAAVNATERWLEGKATAEECSATAHAAYTLHGLQDYAARAASATANAASSFPSAAHNATHVAYCTGGKPELIEAQWNYYNELLYFDDIAEKLLLGGVV